MLQKFVDRSAIASIILGDTRARSPTMEECVAVQANLTLAIDVGTGSIRAALIDHHGRFLALRAQEHEQITPAVGWAEQSPASWWAGVIATVSGVLEDIGNARDRIACVCVCGQMHGTVLVDGQGELTRDTAPLWNDKRTLDHVRRFDSDHAFEEFAALTANPPTPAWPGFKLQWIRDNDPDAYVRSRYVLMPKDYINFMLTGRPATDWTEASCSFLMDPASTAWSEEMVTIMGVRRDLLPEILAPTATIGGVSDAAASATGIKAGTPVLAGAADFSMALLGSGVVRPGMGSEVMGTSSIVTAISAEPILEPTLCNVATIDGLWGAFSLLESGGDALRWSRRTFHPGAASYDEVLALAQAAPAGSGALFFLPYLTGERLGAYRNSRSQFFGIAATHGLSHMHRAVMEGVGFAVAREIGAMGDTGKQIDKIVASGGGTKTALWLKIKASVYGVPLLVPEQPESSLLGCAIVGAIASGAYDDVEQGAAKCVHYRQEVVPDDAWRSVYEKMQPVFNDLYAHSQVFYDRLDKI